MSKANWIFSFLIASMTGYSISHAAVFKVENGLSTGSETQKTFEWTDHQNYLTYKYSNFRIRCLAGQQLVQDAVADTLSYLSSTTVRNFMKAISIPDIISISDFIHPDLIPKKVLETIWTGDDQSTISTPLNDNHILFIATADVKTTSLKDERSDRIYLGSWQVTSSKLPRQTAVTLRTGEMLVPKVLSFELLINHKVVCQSRGDTTQKHCNQVYHP